MYPDEAKSIGATPEGAINEAADRIQDLCKSLWEVNMSLRQTNDRLMGQRNEVAGERETQPKPDGSLNNLFQAIDDMGRQIDCLRADVDRQAGL